MFALIQQYYRPIASTDRYFQLGNIFANILIVSFSEFQKLSSSMILMLCSHNNTTDITWVIVLENGLQASMITSSPPPL